jgi:hypothetical protein
VQGRQTCSAISDFAGWYDTKGRSMTVCCTAASTLSFTLRSWGHPPGALAPASVLSQITENRKVQSRKPLIF